MFSLWRPAAQSAESWRAALVALADSLTALGARQIGVMVVDGEVEKAFPQRMTSSADPLEGMVSLLLDSMALYMPVQAAIEQQARRVHAYQVCEVLPEPEKRTARRAQWHVEVALGQRTPGMCQVAMFRRPARLSLAQWLYSWRDCHGFNAYALQSIFDCRQNLVMQTLSRNAPEVHAIVEEHYPSTAIGNADGFYYAQGDADLLYDKEQALSDSVCSFMDFGSLDCILTSHYQVSA